MLRPSHGRAVKATATATPPASSTRFAPTRSTARPPAQLPATDATPDASRTTLRRSGSPPVAPRTAVAR